MRWITPVVLFASAGFVLWRNQPGSHQVVLFPFMDVIAPWTAGDLTAQGHASAGLLAALGAVTLVIAVVQTLRDRSTTSP
jgi:hypothetical protein